MQTLRFQFHVEWWLCAVYQVELSKLCRNAGRCYSLVIYRMFSRNRVVTRFIIFTAYAAWITWLRCQCKFMWRKRNNYAWWDKCRGMLKQEMTIRFPLNSYVKFTFTLTGLPIDDSLLSQEIKSAIHCTFCFCLPTTIARQSTVKLSLIIQSEIQAWSETPK